MPKLYSRIEFHLKGSYPDRLDKLRLELMEKSKKTITRNQLVKTIVEEFLDKNVPDTGATDKA